MNIPILKLELTGMREQIAMAFTDFQLKQDAMVRESLAKICTPENIQAIMDEAVAKELRAVIENETKSFFAYGEGRALVAAEVIKKLKRETRKSNR